MRLAARWLTAIAAAGICFSAATGYWLACMIPFLIAANIHVVLEPKWDLETELAALLDG